MAKPGRPVPSSQTGRPIMVLLDLLGQRWTMRILWELRESTLTFRQLQAAAGDLSPSVLNRRLHELREALLVQNVNGEGYQLTDAGRELLLHLRPLLDWSERWAKSFEQDDAET